MLKCFVHFCVPLGLQSVETVVSDLVRNYSCAFTPRDIHRMELIIIQKLDFKITTNTPYDFLKIVSPPRCIEALFGMLLCSYSSFMSWGSPMAPSPCQQACRTTNTSATLPSAWRRLSAITFS